MQTFVTYVTSYKFHFSGKSFSLELPLICLVVLWKALVVSYINRWSFMWCKIFMLNFYAVWKSSHNDLWQTGPFMCDNVTRSLIMTWQTRISKWKTISTCQNIVSSFKHWFQGFITIFWILLANLKEKIRFSSSHISENNSYLPITAIPCCTTMNWKFSCCNTYWTLYIIKNLKILSFQKCIIKASHLNYVRKF